MIRKIRRRRSSPLGMCTACGWWWLTDDIILNTLPPFPPFPPFPDQIINPSIVSLPYPSSNASRDQQHIVVTYCLECSCINLWKLVQSLKVSKDFHNCSQKELNPMQAGVSAMQCSGLVWFAPEVNRSIEFWWKVWWFEFSIEFSQKKSPNFGDIFGELKKLVSFWVTKMSPILVTIIPPNFVLFLSPILAKISVIW